MPITDPNQEYFYRGQWIWDGSTWVQVGSIPGYLGHCLEREIDQTADAGTNTFDFGVVPAGEVWAITSNSVKNYDKAAAYITCVVYDDPAYYAIVTSRFSAVTQQINWSGKVWVPEGHNIRVLFYNCDANDTIVVDVTGYKVSVFT